MENSIEVTVDKSHLVTIGERLYKESIELIRELVNNAYDADATEVYITIRDDEIVVSDNGSGMNLEDIKQYFNIGSPFKRTNRKSPIYNRERIGEFGIGKFAVLSASPYFEVWTKKGDFQGKVIFDKEEWEKNRDKWHLPLEIEELDNSKKEGTVVTLKELTKKFEFIDVERRLIESVTIKAPNFNIYLNGKRINPKYIAGHRIPFLEGTDYGIIFGEIIITSSSGADIRNAGIECKVKQVTIKREFFGLEKLVKDIARITGEVNADFLPITSDRTDFIKDSKEYKKFLEVMKIVIERTKSVIEELTDYSENKKTKRVLSDVLEKIKGALRLNPSLCPEGLIPTQENGTDGSSNTSVNEKVEKECKKLKTSKKPKKSSFIKVKRLSPTAIVKRSPVKVDRIPLEKN